MKNRLCSRLNCPIDARKFKQCMFEDPSTCPSYSPDFANENIGQLLMDIAEFVLLRYSKNPKGIEVVYCKDCKHRPIKKEPYYSGFDLDFPPDSKCPCFIKEDEYYSWQPADNWYCANGEKKDSKA